MPKRLTLFILCLCTISALAQEKKKINQDTYDEWATIKSVTLSESGNWVSYELGYLEGDGRLIIRSTETDREVIFDRGKMASFVSDEKALVFLVEPQFDSLRKLKLAETPKDKLPKDSLFIYWTQEDTSISFSEVKSYQTGKNSPWIVMHKTRDMRPDCPEPKKKKKKKKDTCTKPASSGTTLILYNIETHTSELVHCVTSFKLAENGTSLIYTTSSKGKKDTLSVFYRDLNSSEPKTVLTGQYAVSQLSFDEDGNQLAFLASTDTSKLRNFSLYYLQPTSGNLTRIDSAFKDMPSGWNVSEFGSVYFSQTGQDLYFGTNKLVVQEAKDTLLSTEKASVDIWGAEDDRIQPQQLVELNSDKRKSYTAVYHISTQNLVQLATENIPQIRVNQKSDCDQVLGYSDLPYLRESAWSYPWKSDYYLVSKTTGTSSLILSAQGFTTSLSPSGNYIAYYNGNDSAWYCINTQTKQTVKSSAGTPALFASDNNGNPTLADEQGFEGWTLLDGQEYFMVNSRYDVWAFCANQNDRSFCMTSEPGKNKTISYTYYRTDSDSLYTTIENNFFIGVNTDSKIEAIYQPVQSDNSHFNLEKKLESDHKMLTINKADKADKIILRRMSFAEYPDLELTDHEFSNPVKISEANPQQKEYNWGTVEMVSWNSYSGIPLRGLLYKPEDFDSTKQYPMIVYFYEKYTDDIHNYYAPKPTASIVLPTEYVSNGYIIFIPDIIYTPGHPAKSAYDCIVSGTDHLTHRYSWIDSTRLGLQGQSWGGYQTAQLITMTQKYRAAMAGAPVSNMFSAYGGIRWGSGLSRMFQYERTQSRIGYTIWERPDLYIENSPVFGLPQVKTPLLIMSNDGDGAVPWYQGIEMYMGLRRLGQPVWLLNYNDDEHNLTQLANKRDLSIRMRQFFDYYLLGAPMPVWMSDGIDAIDKGKTYGYELEIQQD